MTLETFFEKFDQFVDAPNAVAKMRELVYQLAVQGKLVPQDRSEQSAAVLLEQIRTARAALPANRKTRDERDPIELDADSAPFAAPPGWVWTTLGAVQVFTNGYAFKSEDYLPSGIGIIRMGELGANGEIDETNMKFVSHDIAQSLPENFRVNPGDLLMGMSGSIGKLAMNRSNKTYLLNQRVGRLEPILVEKAFLYAFLKTVEQHYLRISFGMAIKNLSTKQINETPFPLPPLAEQKRIVAKVDELMALCNRLEEQQQERETRHAALARASLARFADAPSPTNLNLLFYPSYIISPADIRKSILNLAVQGKLVLQDPNDTPASEILASGASLPTGHVRRRKIMKRAPIASKDEIFPDLPASWEYADVQTLYDLNLIVDYADGNHGSLYPRSSEFGDSGVTFVTARDIAGGRVLWSRCALLNEYKARQLTKGWARGGDVLLTHNATVGRIARVEREVGEFLLGTSVTFYRLNEDFINPSYFYYVLCSPTWQSQLEAIMEQTTRNQVSIQKQAFFRVPVPPPAEQRRIVAKVDQLMALVDALETQYTTSRKMGASLVDAIVTELTNAA